MREQLLGYLIGALEVDEHQQVEKELEASHDLRRVLDTLRQHVEPLSWDAGHLPPPTGLAARTCEYIQRSNRPTPLHEFGSRPTRWSVQDFMVAASILVAASMLFIPAVAHSRGVARIAQCQNNLRQLGIALTKYSDAHHGYLPYVPPVGNLASSSTFAPRLVSAGLLDEPRILACPDSSAGRNKVRLIPNVEHLENAKATELKELHTTMSGDYRSTVGHISGDQYYPTRHLHRPYFAYAADAPRHHDQQRQSANHGGKGQNVLFDDGHVEFLKTCRCTPKDHPDDIFVNASGEVAPGLNPDDAVIAEDGFQVPPNIKVRPVSSWNTDSE